MSRLRLEDLKPSGEQLNDSLFNQPLKVIDGGNEVEAFNYGSFKPFWYQEIIGHEIFLRKNFRFGALVLPRRAGKTVMACVIAIYKAILKVKAGTNLNVLRYGFVYPELQAGKDVLWDDLELRTVGLPNRKINKQRGIVEFTLMTIPPEEREKEVPQMKPVRVRLQIIGLKNMDSRRGGGFDGLILDESAFLPYGYAKIVNPMLTDKVRQPTWILHITTPEESSDFWSIFDDFRAKQNVGDERYFTVHSSYHKLSHITPEEFEAFTQGMSQEEIDIEFHCKRGVKTGAKFFTEALEKVEVENRVRELSYNNMQRKILSCDIGSTQKDLFAVWCSQYNQATGLHEMVDYAEFPNAREHTVYNWCQNRGHDVGMIILPWDGGVGVKPVAELFREMFPNTSIRVLPHGGREAKIERIRMTRSFLNQVAFDIRNTALGFKHLKTFSKEWDSVKKIYLVKPRHGPDSHGADAFGHMAVADSLKWLEYGDGQDLYGLGKEVLRAETYEPIESEQQFADSVEDPFGLEKELYEGSLDELKLRY